MALTREQILAAIAARPELTESEAESNRLQLAALEAKTVATFAAYTTRERDLAAVDSQYSALVKLAERERHKARVRYGCERRCLLAKVYRFDAIDEIVIHHPSVTVLRSESDLPMPEALKAHMYLVLARKKESSDDEDLEAERKLIYPPRSYRWTGEDIYFDCEHSVMGWLPGSTLKRDLATWAGSMVRRVFEAPPREHN